MHSYVVGLDALYVQEKQFLGLLDCLNDTVKITACIVLISNFSKMYMVNVLTLVASPKGTKDKHGLPCFLL